MKKIIKSFNIISLSLHFPSHTFQCRIKVPNVGCLSFVDCAGLVCYGNNVNRTKELFRVSHSQGIDSLYHLHTRCSTLPLEIPCVFLGFQPLVRKGTGLPVSACSCLGYRGLSLDLCIEPLLVGQLN